MLSKKGFFILISILFFLGLIFLLTSSKISKKPAQITPFPTPTKVPIIKISKTPEGKLNISGVEVNDFTKSPKYMDKIGDILFVDSKEYQILYMEKYNKFLLSILSSPFEEIRQKAELEFLKSLGIPQEEACKLDAEITTPSFANPEQSGKIYRLSFCKNK